MDIYEQMKEKVSMRDVLELYSIHPTRGRNIYRCFVHNDQKPSANIVKGCDKFHCFSCLWTGDIFDVVEFFEKCNRKQSLKIIDERFGLGLLKQLSHKEKLELARQQQERERIKAEKQAQEQFKHSTLDQVKTELKFWKNVQKTAHLTRGEFRRCEWDLCDLFFTALKKQKFLNWVLDVIGGVDRPLCEFDYVYGTDKDKVLMAIKNGEIKIK